MHRHRGPVVLTFQEMMTAANADDAEALLREEADHLLAGETRQLTHGPVRRDPNRAAARPAC